MKYWLSLNGAQLDELFRQGTTPPQLQGWLSGILIVYPGTWFARIATRLMRVFLWQGKQFYPDQGILYNRVSPFQFKAEKAKVYQDESWFDTNEALIVDYAAAGTRLFGWIRDEIREVTPGVYLGRGYRRKSRKMFVYFVLE